MPSLEEKLTDAITAYQLLMAAYLELDATCLGGDATTLERLVAQLDPKISMAKEADRALLDFLASSEDSYNHLPRMREYRTLVAKVAEMNRTLLSHAMTHRALVASEVKELRTGKNALAGYRQQQKQKGSVLSDTF